MSLIEQAAKRLEELRRAGVDIPDSTPTQEVATIESTAQESVAVHANAQFRRQHPSAADVAPRASFQKIPAPPPQSRLVELDLARIAAAGIVTPDAPRSRIADEFRVIKRPLIINATGKGAAPIRNGNLIMVTSALPNEGKSFTAANLAMSIAMELDHTVLLVDADVAHPALPKMLGLPTVQGLLDVLVDDAVELRQVLLRTNVEKLSILTSGTQHPRATELLASDAMNRLLDDMASRYSDRIIVFDSPPLLVTTESRVLATHMGQVVIVVEAQHTTQAAVHQALATIEACPVKLIMLNKGRSVANDGGYGYGYGYGYGGYGYGSGH
ncbi:MAG: tyrosine-protein kinase family protein [Betaproteobacteria bacterium]|nr:tyrosine-protein kinase family protein [Betaproteobacteria bacterium]MBA3775192.1 tyrosine-protein kinase family protein [Betaproteobacteria bacterium]